MCVCVNLTSSASAQTSNVLLYFKMPLGRLGD